MLKAGFQQRGQSTCRAGGTGVTGSLSCEQHHQVPDACARDIADKCFRRKASSHLHTCSGRAKDGDGHEKSDLFLDRVLWNCSYKQGSRFYRLLVTPRDLKQFVLH